MLKKLLILIGVLFLFSPLLLFLATTGDMRWLTNLSAQVERLTPEFLRPKSKAMKPMQNWLVVPKELANNYFKANDVYVLTQPTDFMTYLYASALGQVSMLALGEDGALYVSVSDRGQILRLEDEDNNRVVDSKIIFASGLRSPTGIEFSDGWLYISEADRVTRVRDTDQDHISDQKEVIVSDLSSGMYTSGILHFDAERNLYLARSADCDSCQPSDSSLASILRFAGDGSSETVFASGLRAVGGFLFLPESGEMWAGESGTSQRPRGAFGDEINVLTLGKSYGWPLCLGSDGFDEVYFKNNEASFSIAEASTPVPTIDQAGTVTTGDTPTPTMTLEEQNKLWWESHCKNFEIPKVNLPPMSGPSGMAYVEGTGFPDFLQKKILVVLSGPYDNRKTNEGYKIVSLDPTAENPEPADFMSGWLVGDKRWGKPVDIIVGGPGILYISDQHSGSIYQVVYQKK